MRHSQQQLSVRAALAADGEAILDAADREDRALTDDEVARLDSATQRIQAINAELSKDQQPTFRGQPSGIPSDDDGDARGRRSNVLSYTGRLQAFANNRDGREAAHKCGRFLAATLLQHPASLRWCQQNGVQANPMAALSGGINTAGGALVPDELSRAIIELMDTYGDFRRNASVVPMSSDSLTIPRRTGGLTAYYVGENTAGTESDASWDDVNLTAKKLMCLTRMSSEIAEDAIIDLADRMTQEIGLAFALKEDTVGFTGTGSGSDGGIVGALVKAIDGLHTMAKVTAAANHDLLSEIDADDLMSLMAAVPTWAKKGSKWFCSPTALELVFNAIRVAAGGNSVDNLSNAPQPVFLGYPIIVSPIFPDSASTDYTGLVMLAFGNLAQAATLGSRREVRVALSSDRYFEQDQIAVKGTMRHDINVHDLGSTTIKSPFAVLVGGS